jgi:hypothetical protein
MPPSILGSRAAIGIPAFALNARLSQILAAMLLRKPSDRLFEEVCDDHACNH